MKNFVIKEIKSALTPFEIYKLFYSRKKSFFLDSALTAGKYGRFSYIGADPFLEIEAKSDKVFLREKDEEKVYSGNPFSILDQLIKKYAMDTKCPFDFCGGAIGYLGYELLHHIEKVQSKSIDDLKIPDMVFGFYDRFIIIDHALNKIYAVGSDPGNLNIFNPGQRVKELKAFVLDQSKRKSHESQGAHFEEPSIVSNFTQVEYLNTIKKAKESIRKGDIYQVNLSQRFTVKTDVNPLSIYDRLRSCNPAPFGACIDYNSFKILSSSPERFLKIKGRYVESRPIKGTTGRGKTQIEDQDKMEELYNSEKDRAENLMIVDLVRNDLGRVCTVGSVTVPEIFRVETYATVHHLVSTVTGTIKKETGIIDVIKACFPGGSITGTPKIKAMEIIQDLEPVSRNVYTGAIGYIGFNGTVDLNIAIRTIVVKDGYAYYNVGGGIVWDSVPESEYQETLDKGLGLKQVFLKNRPS